MTSIKASLLRSAIQASQSPQVGDLIECLKDVGNITNSPWTAEVEAVEGQSYKTSYGDDLYQIPSDAFTRTYTTDNGQTVYVVE